MHFIGIDNVQFHTLMFPATIMGSQLPYCNKICTHVATTYFLHYEGKKFSKRNNIGLFGNDVQKLSERLGITEDYWRFYLMKIRPETADSSFVWHDFLNCIRSDLCGNIGNYINRCVCMTKKYCGGGMVRGVISDTKLINELNGIMETYHNNMKLFKLRDALMTILTFSDRGNVYVNQSQLWKLTNTAEEKQQQTILLHTNLIIYFLLKMLSPIMPNSMSWLQSCFTTTIEEMGDPPQDTWNVQLYIGKHFTFEVNYDKYKLPFKTVDSEQAKVILESEGIYVTSL